jgi:DNA-binding MarR family transcriptional regulator
VAYDFERHHDSAGGWAKRFHLVNKAAMEAMLRPFDLGVTQWMVLLQLTENGPMVQGDIARALEVERATLSGVVSTLVRKGLVEQRTDAADQRRRLIALTQAGQALWAKLPDPVGDTLAIAFEGEDPDELATVGRVLSRAAQRLADAVGQNTMGRS